MTNTNLTLQIYALSPDNARTFWQALRDALGISDDPPPASGGQITLQTEVDAGTVDRLAPQLRKLDPRAIWVAHEDPAGEHLGTCAMAHPSFSLFTAPCDADGKVALTYAELSQAAQAGEAGALRRSFGLDIATSIALFASGSSTAETPAGPDLTAGRTPRPLDRLVTMLKDRGWRLSSSCGNADIWRHRLSRGEELRVLRYASERDGDDYDAAYDAALARLTPLPAQGPVAGLRLDTDPAE